MEDIYLKGFSREWLSERVDLKEYFEKYSNAVSRTVGCQKPKRLKNIMNVLLPQSKDLTKNELYQLNSLTNVNQLKFPTEVADKLRLQKNNCSTMYKKHTLNKACPKIQGGINKKRAGLNQRKIVKSNIGDEGDKKHWDETINTPGEESGSVDLNKEPKPSTSWQHVNDLSDKETVSDIRNRSRRIDTENLMTSVGTSKKLKSKTQNKYFTPKDAVITRRGEIVLDSRSLKQNLPRGKHYIVSFRVQKPYLYSQNSKIENLMQEILVLNDQSLQDLRDKIICCSDFQDVQGDVSEHPDAPILSMAMNLFKSAMFYIDNTFYIDTRYPGNQDYSGVIKEWGRSRSIAFGHTKEMSDTMVGDLKVRFGYPYLYVHQGYCEHLVIINDARLLTGKESLDSSDYPLISRIPHHNTRNCYICENAPPRWLVKGNERLLLDTTFLCHYCFKMYNYINDQKVGKFKAFRYFPRNMLL